MHPLLRGSRLWLQQDDGNRAGRVVLVYVVSTPCSRVHDRRETHVMAVDQRPQSLAFLGGGHPRPC
jgi:hypothetical protein